MELLCQSAIQNRQFWWRLISEFFPHTRRAVRQSKDTDAVSKQQFGSCCVHALSFQPDTTSSYYVDDLARRLVCTTYMRLYH